MNTGIFVAYFMYRSRYSYLSGFEQTERGNTLQYSDVSHCLKFSSEGEARGYLVSNTRNPQLHFIVELSVQELLQESLLRRVAAQMDDLHDLEREDAFISGFHAAVEMMTKEVQNHAA